MPLEQLVNTAGDGNLKDNTLASEELRKFFSENKTEMLEGYVDACLTKPFQASGYVLQDLVNELGARLDYDVEFGLYRGKRNSIGFDGVWRAPDQADIVVEVKTTDAYRINLDTIANYRSRLVEKGALGNDSSILLVVGREDTGDIEAQIRGSRHAWLIRIISTESLLKLVELKESSDENMTLQKIQSLLVPFEYTRLDRIVDIMFSTASDVTSSGSIEELDSNSTDTKVSRKLLRTDTNTINSKRESIVASFGKNKGINLIKKSKALYWARDESVGVACSISKRYEKNYAYWYAFRFKWLEFLRGTSTGFYLVGFVDSDDVIALPLEFMEKHLDKLSKTERDGNKYWHVFIHQDEHGEYYFPITGQPHIPIGEYKTVG
jgi:hypothetical protein